jgi:hypothetical protein
MARHKKRTGKKAFHRCLSTNLKGKHCKTKKCKKNLMKRVMRKCRKRL